MPSHAAVESALQKIGLRIPAASPPAASYIPFQKCNNILFISGQIPMIDGELKGVGQLGKEGFTIEQGQEVARMCALNIISQAQAGVGGDLGRIKRFLKLEGFVSSTPDFFEHHKVINGASDLIVDIFGKEVGQHSRFAVGCAALPMGVAVEIGAVVEIAEEQ